MQTESKRVQVQFPEVPAPNAVIGITNQDTTGREHNASDLQAALVLKDVTPFIEKAPEHRGIPQSALHDGSTDARTKYIT